MDIHLNSLGIKILGGKLTKNTNANVAKETECNTTKVSQICNRSFEHVSLENMQTFLKKKHNYLISGVDILENKSHMEPMKSALLEFLDYLKGELYDLLKKGRSLPQHETRRIETFLQTEFFKLQTNVQVHERFVHSLQSLKSMENSLSKNTQDIQTCDISVSADENTSIDDVEVNCLLSHSSEEYNHLNNCGTDHIYKKQTIHNDHSYFSMPCDSSINRSSSPDRINDTDSSILCEHNYHYSAFDESSTDTNIHAMYTATPLPTNEESHVQKDTTKNDDTTVIPEHSYTKEDTEDRNLSNATVAFPLTAPSIPSITKKKIPLIDFDDLPLSSYDCYFLVLSMCLYFWSTIHWPVLNKTQILDDIETITINTCDSEQDKQKRFYVYGWVIMATRNEMKSMADDCDLRKESLIKIISHLGMDKVSGTLHTGGDMHNFDANEEVYDFFAFLDAASMQLLDKQHLLTEKHNAVESAIDKLKTCHRLRKLFLDMLTRCDVDLNCATKVEKLYLLQKLVEKFMRSRQKTEIRRYNYQPKKMSSTTRGEIKAKCSKAKAKKQQKANETESNTVQNQTVDQPSKSNNATSKLVNKRNLIGGNSKDEEASDITSVDKSKEESGPSTVKKCKTLTLDTNDNYEKSKTGLTIKEMYDYPQLLVGSKIKHKWKMNKKFVHLNGEILGLTTNDVPPDDLDDDKLDDEVCFDVKYSKYKNKIYHYRILPDIVSGDLKIVD